ncbi:FprA family A-type flavoprotein [Anaerorhabdus sp.]|uniref:FprA family A-type flavoprotein n=1 Tax=Anaerorhabdus sp. TaxID=1872524 RepID=UPI002FC705E1
MKQAIQIKPNIYWVGVHDFNCRHFHGDLFPISEGTTYNSYLIVDEEITLIDTVEEEFFDVMMERIHSVIGDKKIDNVIVQHAEPDHSSGFTKFMECYPNAKPFASNASILIMLKQYFKDYNFTKVKTGDTLCSGKLTLTFIEMPMIHWPDNMLTYVEKEKIAFSNDAFGQHIASYDIFDDAHGLSKCIDQAKNYYANIVMPYGTQVANKLKQIQDMDLDIDMIAPAHGIIWRTYIPELLSAYQDFATFKASDKAVIVYESIWKHTQMMAEALAEGMGRNGICVKIYKCSATSPEIIMKELLDAKVIMVGSGNYNNAMAGSIAAFLEKLGSCKVKGKKALGFGSYGWFNGITKQINERLVKGGIPLLNDQILAQNYTPTTTDLDSLHEIGKAIAQEIKNM